MTITSNVTTIKIPDYDGVKIIEIKVRRPQLMNMMRNGKIPNHLLGPATRAALGKQPEMSSENDLENAKELADWIAFYCEICMVSPSYEEMGDNITDDQALSIYTWAISPLTYLRTFRDNSKDDPDHRDGKAVPKKTK